MKSSFLFCRMRLNRFICTHKCCMCCGFRDFLQPICKQFISILPQAPVTFVFVHKHILYVVYVVILPSLQSRNIEKHMCSTTSA